MLRGEVEQDNGKLGAPLSAECPLVPASPSSCFISSCPTTKAGPGGAATFYRRESQLERRQDTDQETGARDGKALFVEVGTAEEQEHIGLVLLPVLSKDLGELPQLR